MSPTLSPPQTSCGRMRRAPAILIGHSLGGAAVLAAAADVPEARAVVTIAAPSDPTHVTGAVRGAHLEEIGTKGEVEVALAGRPFRIRRAFVDDIAEHRLLDRLRRPAQGAADACIRRPTHSSVSRMRARIFTAAKHPKSFVSLGRCRPPAEPSQRCRLRRQRDRTPGPSAISTWRRSRRPARRDPTPSLFARRATVSFQQQVTVGRASLPGGRADRLSAASTAVRARTISCWPGWAPARR